jgi:hypothetical protein
VSDDNHQLPPGYPLQPAGVRDYPVKVGSMLLTMVEPHKGYEVAYNRWYERDHFYAGCMVGPWLFAGGRFVATRELKDLRWPQGSTMVANPWDAGSYIAIYWVEKGHHDEHFDDFAKTQVFWLYSNGRGFAERTHVHTVLFDHLDASYRDADPIPVELALDCGYDGLVVAWLDARGSTAADLVPRLGERLQQLTADTGIEIASSWTTTQGPSGDRSGPMDLGGAPGGPERLVQLFFVRGDVREQLGALRAYTDGLEADGLADVRLVAPFFATKLGTDTYTDQLW